MDFKRAAGSVGAQPRPNGIRILGDVQKDETSIGNEGQARKRRVMKESEDEILKKIAHAEAVNKGLVKGGMGSVKRNQDRAMVEAMRDPAKLNAMVYAKEFGGPIPLK